MERFSLGHAGGADWRQALAACLEQIAPLSPSASLGFLYLSHHFAAAAPEIRDRLCAATGIERWVGTSGVGVCATGREYFDEPAMALLAADFPERCLRLFDVGERGIDRFLEANRAWLEATPSCFGVVHGDPRSAEAPRLVPRFAEATNAYLVGGLTSSEGAFPQFAGGLASGVVSGVLFSDEVAVATGLTQGCSPLGPQHQVTECEHNVAITLDRRPALEVLKEDVGELLARDLGRIGGYVYAAFPVEGSDRADYLVRSLVGLDLDQGLVAVGDALEEGQRLMFCRRDRDTARHDLERMLSDLKRRAGGAPRGALYCSCVARGPNMFGPDSGELRTIQAALGEVPLVGFFGNGEFSHDRLYTYTGVLALFL
jgi:small ligand-binding sensory domain FIST